MEFRNFTMQLLIAAGALSLRLRSSSAKSAASDKHGAESALSSDADKAEKTIEQFICQQLRSKFPGHKIIGKKLGGAPPEPRDYCWLVEPLGGTLNFFSGFAYYSISMALLHKSQILLGAVYCPALGKLYLAERGGGAQSYAVMPTTQSQLQPGRQLQVGTLEKLSASVLLTGFGFLCSALQPNNYLYLGYILPHIKDIRCLGSPALAICLVAAGVYDGFWQLGLNIYTVAAACLILEESGGMYSDLYGSKTDFPASILVAGPGLHSQLLGLLAAADKPYNGFRSLLQNLN